MDLILVVCGAGASSTFLASRLRSLATARGLEVAARAVSVADLPAQLHDATVLLVGPHLEAGFAALRDQAAEHLVPAGLLPATAFGPSGASDALEQALRLLHATTEGTINA